MDEVVDFAAKDLTATLQAGVRLAAAQETFAEAGEFMALDPPLGQGEAATVGGIMASGDSGPLRHRYGAVRDLVLGVTVALADGTVARAGGKVIKNVAGYDLAKLFTGSFGTLGLILEVTVRLHPLPVGTTTVAASSDDPEALGQALTVWGRTPLEPEALDVRWAEEGGTIALRMGGAALAERADRALQAVAEAPVATEVWEDDDGFWSEQARRQRSSEGAIVRVSGLAAELPKVLAATRDAGADLVGRAALGLSWVSLPRAEPEELIGAVEQLRARLFPRPCVLLDAPDEVRGKLDPWGSSDEGVLTLMRRVKERFDPNGVMNPGVFVGGI
jgi:glycolate dehydrogenase FAD-binding subunit